MLESRERPQLGAGRRAAVLIAIGLLAALCALRSPQPAGAIYHIAFIEEVMVGFDGDPEVQFIEIRMDFPGQHLVHDTRLTVWNAEGTEFEVLLLLPHDVANDGYNVRWIMATQAFATATGMTPDFIMPPDLPSPTGMICWGGPDTPLPSDDWMPGFPFLYTDCVAYGGYSGEAASIHPPPFPDAPGDGLLSMQRIAPPPTEPPASAQILHINAPPDFDAFAYRCPSPENNAGEVVLLGDDSDADGLPDCHEGEAGTDPELPDTDGDSYSDGEEYLKGSDPLDPDSTPGLAGDASCDGAVSAIDSALILQAVAGLIASVPCPENADAVLDGHVNALDATVILQFVAGLVHSLPP